MSQLVKILSIPLRWLMFIYFCMVSISILSDHRERGTIIFFFDLHNHTLSALMKNKVLIFKVFGSDLHKLSHFNSRISTLDFTWNCCRILAAKKFSRNLDHLFKWTTRKKQISPIHCNTWSQEPSCRISPETYRLAEKLYFSGGNQFFQ